MNGPLGRWTDAVKIRGDAESSGDILCIQVGYLYSHNYIIFHSVSHLFSVALPLITDLFNRDICGNMKST